MQKFKLYYKNCIKFQFLYVIILKNYLFCIVFHYCNISILKNWIIYRYQPFQTAIHNRNSCQSLFYWIEITVFMPPTRQYPNPKISPSSSSSMISSSSSSSSSSSFQPPPVDCSRRSATSSILDTDARTTPPPNKRPSHITLDCDDKGGVTYYLSDVMLTHTHNHILKYKTRPEGEIILLYQSFFPLTNDYHWKIVRFEPPSFVSKRNETKGKRGENRIIMKQTITYGLHKAHFERAESSS